MDLLLAAIVAAAVAFLTTYVREKGKNAATKEDIAGITDEVESVKNEYQRQLEELKAALASAAHIHRAQCELEIESYARIWKAAVRVKNAVLGIQPLARLTELPGTERARSAAT